MKIPFNKPYLTGKEQLYIAQAITTTSVDEKGSFSDRCIHFMQNRYGYKNTKLTSSTAHAIKLVAELTRVKKGEEVLIPAFCNELFASAFAQLGADVRFMDSSNDSPNVDYDVISKSISVNTKVVVVSHYGGNACSMAPIIRLAKERNIIIIEDATDALDSRHRGENIGKMGQLSVFSFHESKTITAIDMGMVVVNDESLMDSEEKTEQNEYCKINQLSCAYLLAQLEDIELIQRKRLNEWINYYNDLEALAKKQGLELPRLSFEDRPNGQIFYIVCNNINQRNELAAFLRGGEIDSLPHYVPLHTVTQYGADEGKEYPNAARYGNCLLRLPMYNELNDKQRSIVTNAVKTFFKA